MDLVKRQVGALLQPAASGNYFGNLQSRTALTV
jgi:hypothetical protein